MRKILVNTFYSLPVQLFILHFRKFQILLLFWVILFATVASSFMKNFGADALFFSPEYLGTVNMLGAFITGTSLGVFIMSWNITTFILHSRRLKFLATTSNPFLKYCINNAVIPLVFVLFYLVKLYRFNDYKELMPLPEILGEMFGIISGVTILILFSFAYFFGAGKTIDYSMVPIISNPDRFNKTFSAKENKYNEHGLKVYWYINTGFKISKCRNVTHYRQDFLDTVFKRHHLAAIIGIVIAFILTVTSGFLQSYKMFEIPAAASITVVFALLIAVIGALVYFLQSWSLPAVIVFVFVLDVLFEKEIIDPRNKAYGLNYTNKIDKPNYNKQALQAICSNANIAADKANMLAILNNWKAKQTTDKPLMVFIDVSGGGLRSAAFTMNALQKTDSLCSGNLMQKTFMINGASGGMLAAAYYRALYKNKLANDTQNIYQQKYTNKIAGDLLNPIFTSFMARDVFAPIQKFEVGNNKYVKDRGYAFEKKLGENTDGLLNIQMKDVAEDEKNATIPLIIFNSVVKTDARKMMISTQPISFMMKPADANANIDAVDFSALFAKQNPMDLRMLTALRMNATFPYVLPNVWLPTNPIIDVMDAGLRDNFGQESTLRFIDNFKDWISQNTSGVLIVQIRDRQNDNWKQPFETKSITDLVVTPSTMLQYNWFKLQDAYQADAFKYFKDGVSFTVNKANIMYMPQKEDANASLNFHLSAREKRDVIAAYNNETNQKEVKRIVGLVK